MAAEELRARCRVRGGVLDDDDREDPAIAGRAGASLWLPLVVSWSEENVSVEPPVADIVPATKRADCQL